uniref:ABC transporter permease n=1 Tax=Polysiphonia sp. TaxID=1967842 RepID=A0A1Z1MT36_9FLOR|nr:hypothetical protein [Polysiphonia sp.]
MYKLRFKIKLLIKILYNLSKLSTIIKLDNEVFIIHMLLIGFDSLLITMVTSFFISLVLSLQIVKEFVYLNATDLIGSVLTISFIRELSPVLTAIIFIGKVGSAVTSELATMKVSEQIDCLFILGIDPIAYLVLPRVIAAACTLPLLNLFFLFTSCISSSFICFVLYSISPAFFLSIFFYIAFYTDILRSILKAFIFGLVISTVSCTWGITTIGGSKGVGFATTSSVVVSLVLIFILNFILSYLMFYDSLSTFEIL